MWWLSKTGCPPCINKGCLLYSTQPCVWVHSVSKQCIFMKRVTPKHTMTPRHTLCSLKRQQRFHFHFHNNEKHFQELQHRFTSTLCGLMLFPRLNVGPFRWINHKNFSFKEMDSFTGTRNNKLSLDKFDSKLCGFLSFHSFPIQRPNTLGVGWISLIVTIANF